MISNRKRMDIRLGFECNNACLFCAVGLERETISSKTTGQVKEDITEAKKLGIDQLDFTGGEPTIRKDIFEIISYAKSLGFPIIQMQSNGRMFSYKNFSDRLIKSGLTAIGFLFPSHKKQIYELLTQAKGSYGQVLKAFENIKDSDLHISTITVVNKYNFEDLPETTRFLAGLNNKFKNYFAEFNFIMPSGDAWKNKERLIPKITKTIPYIKKSLNISKKNNFELNIEGIPLCFLQGFEDNIVEFGMASDWQMRMGNGIVEDFNKRRLEKGRSKGPQCEECNLNNKCNGLYKGYELIHGFGELKPI
ncbi:radical SAM protein [Candidatus Woesearchaeota archaeon]|nr:radical SAM protein [Candidatus Woesearchaeota archaeon]